MDTKAGSKIQKSEAEWRKQLTPAQFHVTREHGTERAFTGPYWDEKRAGLYRCIGCDTPLFSADTKYDSGTGWPSFFAPVDDGAVSEHVDGSWLMRRTEIAARVATRILGTCFPTGQSRPASAIA